MRLVRIVAAVASAAAVLGGLLGIALARRLVLPRAARTVRVHRISAHSVTLDADSKTTHVGANSGCGLMRKACTRESVASWGPTSPPERWNERYSG
jgi:hypothetical protein